MTGRTSSRGASRAGDVVTGAVGGARARVGDLGEYLREQRKQARMSLRQLADVAGVSNPYLSQVERGLRRPSAEVLQQIAHGLRISAEALYVRAGLLDRPDGDGDAARAGESVAVREAIAADPRLTERQRQALLDIYDSFVGDGGSTREDTAPSAPGD